jgi:hypothetical protein
VHDAKVMAEEIVLPIRKLLKNASLGNFCLPD